jgi:hypothetical protein
MTHLTMHERRADARIAAIGDAYELYVGRLRVLNRLCCSRRNGDAEQARQIAHARLLVEEAYARWFMLARPDMTGMSRDSSDAQRA